VRLYISLQKVIRSRVGNKQLDRSVQKKQWTKYLGLQKRMQFNREEYIRFITHSVEIEIVHEYLKSQMIAKVKTYLAEKYPDHKNIFTL
jgi:hypothetical protein